MRRVKMKRIFIASLLALTIALGAVATGCSGGNNSSSVGWKQLHCQSYKRCRKKSEIVIPENCIDLRIDDCANGEDNYFSENDKLESVVAKLAYESAKHSANSTCHMVVQKYIINRSYH